MRLFIIEERPKEEREFSVAVVIPTLNRPKELLLTLEQLKGQTLKPKIVIIVDSSHGLIDTSIYNTEWSLFHVKSTVRSSAVQRNIGMKMLENSIFDFLLFHDDDMDISPNYIFRMVESFKLGEGVVGVSGIALSGDEEDLLIKKKRKKSNFFIRPGTVTKGGINVPVTRLDGSIVECDWLIGCSMWRKLSAKVYFESKLTGYAIFEDVIFSMKVKREEKAKLLVNTGIAIRHRREGSNSADTFSKKRDWIVNRFIASRLLPENIWYSRMWIINVLYLFFTLLRIPLNPKVYFIEFKGLLAGISIILRAYE